VRPEQFRRFKDRKQNIEEPSSASMERLLVDNRFEAIKGDDPADGNFKDDPLWEDERENIRLQNLDGELVVVEDVPRSGVVRGTGVDEDENEYELLDPVKGSTNEGCVGEEDEAERLVACEFGADVEEEEDCTDGVDVTVEAKLGGNKCKRSASVRDVEWERSSEVSWKQRLEMAAIVRLEKVPQ